MTAAQDLTTQAGQNITTETAIPITTEGVITMPASLIVGTTHTATFTANGPIYNSPAWSIIPVTAATLTPAPISSANPDVATCSVQLLTAGPFTLTCTADADPNPGAKPITQSLSSTVILQEATSATLMMP